MQYCMVALSENFGVFLQPVYPVIELRKLTVRPGLLMKTNLPISKDQ